MGKTFPIHPSVPAGDQPDLAYALKHPWESGLVFMGHVNLEHFRDGSLIYREEGKNVFTIEGRALILNAIFGDANAPANVYMGIFKSNITPVAGDTASARLGASGTYGECQDADYDPATNRPEYVIASTSTEVCTNEGNKAEFDIKQEITVYGAFLATSQAKTSTSGALICARRFDSSRQVIAGDQLAVKYQITASTT